MHLRVLAALATLVLARPAAAVGGPLEQIVDGLVHQVLASNLEVAGAEASVAQRLAALDAAKARYWPSLDLAARYTRSEGGREIEVPVGDLMNPVYSTLNDLLAAQGKPAPFQPIDNFSIPLQREQEQVTALVLTQPVFDLRIGAARRIAESQHLASIGGLDALRNRLVRETRQGYYRWLGVGEAVGILDATLELTRSNLAVNQSLFRNGKITEDLVFRAEADVLEIEQQALAATNALVLARAWVNLLRNRPAETELPHVAVTDADVARTRSVVAAATGSPTLQLDVLQAEATANRPELRQLDAIVAAASAGKDLAFAANYPVMGVAVDAGSQGETYEFGQDNLYLLASLVVRFNFFRGGADLAAVREAQARIGEVRAARAYAEEKIRVEVLDSLQILAVAESSLQTAERRVAAADAAFRIAARKRDLGQVNQTEFIDARRTLTDAQLNRNRTRFEALSALAAVAYAAGVPAPDVSRNEVP